MAFPPPPHALAAILIALAMFVGFARGQRVEIVSLLVIGLIAVGLYFYPLPGASSSDGLAMAFGGFGHPALITICALMILGRGLVVTGALDPAARVLARVWRLSANLGLLVTLCLAFALSMVVNDTPVLVLLLPIMVQLAAQGAMPASKTLIPINAAVLIGGMATTIGTSTNLLVVSIATDLGMTPLSVFHYTPLVLAAALIALPYIWLVMPRLLPDNSTAAGHQGRRYEAILRFPPQSQFMGKRVLDLIDLTDTGATFRNLPDGNIHPDTRIEVIGTESALLEAARRCGGHLSPTWLVDRLRRDANARQEDMVLAEMSVPPDSRLIGLTLAGAGLEGVAVAGIHRALRFGEEAGAFGPEDPLREGDILLVQGTWASLQAFSQRDGVLLLDGGKDMPRSAKATLALVIMGGSVLLASLGLLPIAISALGGALLMFVTGCVRFDRVGRALSAKVIVLVAASIALGKAIQDSGAAEWLGQILASGLQFLPAAGVLAAIMLFVTLLTNFASNATAAAVGTPIAFSIARQLGIPPEPLVLAVLFGCNLCYATPVAYQTNMLIMAEGDYRFQDYLRTGLPLVLLMVVTLSGLLVMNYGL